MASINVDFEVFKELTMRRRSEAMTENDVIRELLGLSRHVPEEGQPSAAAKGGTPWVVKGVTFPHGTEFRVTYKGQQYTGVVRNGCLIMDGKPFTSPSAAAVSITGNNVNGWNFWECRFPETSQWQLIGTLRQ